MKKNHDILQLPGTLHHQTASAYLFSGEDADNGEPGDKVWLPKSQCEWDDSEGTMQIPEWLAIEKELV